jgi:hypothetical protein
MKKAIVTLVMRQVINSDTSDKTLQEIHDSSFREIEIIFSHSGRNSYSLNTNGRDSQFKKAIDDAATIGSMNSIFKLNRFIPELWDVSHRINLRMLMEPGKFPSVKVEVIEFISGGKEKLQLAVYYEAEHLILLDSIDNKLLLSFPNTTGEDDETQVNFTNTFFLQLTDALFFKDYKLLEK